MSDLPAIGSPLWEAMYPLLDKPMALDPAYGEVIRVKESSVMAEGNNSRDQWDEFYDSAGNIWRGHPDDLEKVQDNEPVPVNMVRIRRTIIVEQLVDRGSYMSHDGAMSEGAIVEHEMGVGLDEVIDTIGDDEMLIHATQVTFGRTT